MRSKRKIALIIVALVVVLMGAMLLSLSFGAAHIEFGDIVKMCLNKLPFVHFAPSWQPVEQDIIFQMRFPHVVGGVLVGAALATAGVLFQGLLRNPLADPYIIGTSAGAALGAAIAMVLLPTGFLFLGFGLIPIAAFCGALGAVFLVYNLARVGGKTPVVSMLLAGFAVGAFFTAIAWFMLSVSGDFQHNLQAMFDFLLGAIKVTDWSQIAIMGPLIFGGIIVAQVFAFHLNAFSLGEEGAAYLGINVERDKIGILSLGSLLTACAVCIGGLIGFVGLVMPHAMRLLLGPDHRLLLPASALAGASFLTVADLASRTIIAPGMLRIGIITALVGAPFFIYLLRRYRKEYAF